MRNKVSVLLAATLALTAAPLAHAGPADPVDPAGKYADQAVTWGECAFTPTAPLECALITVPRDWADPGSGAELEVSISRSRATGERRGAMLVNPGGPGGQGTGLAGDLAALAPDLGGAYDLIGMDPRGTGQQGVAGSAFTCDVPTDRLPTGPLDARDRSAASLAEHAKEPRAVAESCQSDARTPYVTTWQTAHDVDLVRALLGEERLHYLGYSYGSWLGAKYASLFPDRVGKVVLDSSVNWQGRLQAAFEAWPEIGDRQLTQQYFPWLARQFPDAVGDDPRGAWERARKVYAEQGVAPDAYDRIFVGMGNELVWLLSAAVLVAALGEEPEVPEALRARLDEVSVREFGVPLGGLTPAKVAEELADYTSYPGTYYAVTCGDEVTRTAAQNKALSDRQGPRWPVFGWAYGLWQACGHWSEAPRQQLPTLPPQVADRVLVVQSEFDPQTGYEQARAAVRAAPGVGFVQVADSTTHGQYVVDGNPCVDGAVNVFLLRDSRPGRITCPGLPLPGEDRVFPADGPVRDAVSAPMTAGSAPSGDPALRAGVQERIGAGFRR
ncbi:alpha/beta fold hydrolase [Actinosynnema pretiosum subsp. pretiosum]|uniref:Alpha/beta fold hydrolase n=1 Tax=Actinosynnema pretiosum subsp. pretiosum TaxID=103721 RepID=A0AA45L886_9PSEU|nr:Proteinase [Actinosynnema pretiosum subsp. pretiosum]QUF04600.1 alpha/beta fold hydrolase [Actinosynnema pretiosum subsp. pretiosum]